jgi:hypothetical protein
MPASAEPMPDYTLETAINEVRHDIRATVIGIRRERDYWRATYTRLSTDTRLLQERLSVSSITESAR